METKEFMISFPDFYIQTLDDKKLNRNELITHGTPFEYTKDRLKELNEKGAGIFFSPNRFKKRRIASECSGVNSWFIDLDKGTKEEQINKIKNSPLLPHYIVESSNGYHCYWLSDNAKIENFTKIQKALIKYFDSDPACKDITRVLRIPNFYHNKKEPFMVKVVDIILKGDSLLEAAKQIFLNKKYTEEEMTNAFPIEDEKPVVEMQPKGDTIWERIFWLDCKTSLEKLSGRKEVRGETYTFKERSGGGFHILINEKSCNAWIDNNGRIGSGSKGEGIRNACPSIIQWLEFYGWHRKDIIRIAKEVFGVKEHKEKENDILKRFLTKTPENYRTWGVKCLDYKFKKPLQNDYVLFLGEAGSGKTSFCLNMAIENAKKGIKVLFLSIEMSKQVTCDRYIEIFAGITEQDRNNTSYSREQLEKIAFCIKELQHPNIKILDKDDIEDPRNIIQLEKIMIDYDMIFIDNLSFIVPRGEKEFQAQGIVSEQILNFVNINNKTVIMLHHYAKGNKNDRGMEARGNQKLIDDCTIHASIKREEDSDMVGFTVRKNRLNGQLGTEFIYYQRGKYKGKNELLK